MTRTLPVSVVIPTIGRPKLLEACLGSLGECDPRAAEILVVDQSGDAGVGAVVSRFTQIGARLVPCNGRGVSRARNVGLQEAQHEIVLITDDDCRVTPSWVATAWKVMAETPDGIVTGRLLPLGDTDRVPFPRENTVPHDYVGEVYPWVLYAGNMVLNRSRVAAFGGFDERFGPSEPAEDCDFCYRWLRAGNPLRYEPSLAVWHVDWRTERQMKELYAGYWHGTGFFWAKQLRQRDFRILRFIVHDSQSMIRASLGSFVRPQRGRVDPSRGFLRGVSRGFVRGWRVFDERRSKRATASAGVAKRDR